VKCWLGCILIKNLENIEVDYFSLSSQGDIEAKKEVCIDADKILLGSQAVQSIVPEPAVLGNRHTKFVETLLEMLIQLSETLVNLDVESDIAINELKSFGAVSQAYIRSLNTQLPTLNSSKVFIDTGE
jgi:hypothetical protein